ncbi:MAG: hypothetical protein LBE22_04085 [Azoarcus sp.]|jgi:hypothetical protein|nr:hypothetical protein [Azoarcus sp.]
MLHPSSSALLKKYAFTMAICLAPAIAFAEVSDKVPTLCSVWIIGVSAALVCFAASYFLRWYGMIVAVFPLALFAIDLIDLHFSDVGRALYIEQGATYFIQSYLAAFLVLIGAVVGLFLNKKKQNVS